MDNIVVEAYALSCILPLLAFILLAFQFYCQSLFTTNKNALPSEHHPEFPCRMAGIISISSQIEQPQRTDNKHIKEIETEEKAFSEIE